MTATVVIKALGLPQGAAVGSRIAKNLVIQKGAASAGDRRLVQDGIERLTWVAQVKPGNVGIEPAQDPDSLAVELSVLRLEPRVSSAKLDRLVEIVHRAIPYPLLLVLEHGPVAAISVASKRHSQADVDGVVLVAPAVTASIDEPNTQLLDDVCRALRESLDRVGDLGDLYDRWAAVAVAARARAISGTFQLTDPSAVWDRWGQVREWERLEEEIARIGARARMATQMSDRVKLNGKLQQLRAEQQRALELV